jgi:putative N6-adenine-specific DNA methylase
LTRLYATCAQGTEDLVAAELAGLGFSGIKRQHGAAHFAADAGTELVSAMRACLHLRAALRVLLPLATFPAPDAAALYQGVRELPWERWLTARSTLAVWATSRAAPPLAHGPFLAQRVKDGVVDRLRDVLGGRPNVNPDDPDVQLYVHIESAARGKGGLPAATVGLDVSGRSLHARGYRVAQGEAPLRESLAAAVLLATGWSPTEGKPLVDPMCGSGTLVIEAALLALSIAPGRAAGQRRFGFERWPTLGEAEHAAWRRLVEEADAQARARSPVAIIGADRDPELIAMARQNARAAGRAVEAAIEWRVGDVRALLPCDPPGVIVSNPPYGERLGDKADKVMEGFWRGLGAHLRTLDGHTAFLLCASKDMERSLGMRPTWQHWLKNGPISVALCRYELGRQRWSMGIRS